MLPTAVFFDIPPCTVDKLVKQLQKFLETHPEMKDFGILQSTLAVYAKDEMIVFE